MSSSPLRRPRALRALNSGGRLLRRLGVRPVDLAPDSLLAGASRRAGLADFGDARFREALERLSRALDEEARLSLLGRLIARRDLVQTLENRLRLLDERRRHPEIADEPIEAPLFIVGLPRTGTSILHELLAQDPENRVPLTWEVMWPCPRPEAGSFDTDPRIARAERQLGAADRLIPDFKKMHRMGARLPQECCMLMNHDLMSVQFHTTYNVPSYQDWLNRQDLAPVYAFHRAQLQHLQSRAPARHWVLKSPQHLWTLEALLRVYPDARIVHTHRDPLKAVTSVASLVSLLRSMASDDVDPLEIGADWTRLIADAVDRTLRVREARSGEPERFFDMHFREYLADPVAMVGRIYRHFGRGLSPGAEQRMRRYLAAHPADEHGRHRYAPEAFGLDPRALRARFERYRERFAVAEEP